MTRKLNKLLLLALVFVGVPFAWLMLDTSSTAADNKPVDITQLRALAASLPGVAPKEARYETIGRRRIVGDLLAAGSGLRPVTFAIRAYQLYAPDGQSVTIDRGMPRELAEQHRISDFDPIAQAHVDQAVAGARIALMLSRKPQHSGSVVSPVEGKTRLPPAYAASAGAPYAVAPGVVVIPADGVRRADCMVFARLSGGREILFTGDVAAINVSWIEQRPPARIVTTFLAPGDREQIASWLRTIRSLKAQAPALQIVAGHDAALPRMVKRDFIDDP